MKSEYYNADKLAKIIFTLIYLHQEMKADKYVDRQSCLDLLNVINTLQYYLQFLTPNRKEAIKYYKG